MKTKKNRLLLNHSQACDSPCALISDLNRESYLNPILNPDPTDKWSLFSRLAEHWSRDHLKSRFLPITPQGCIFTLRHAGWSGISVKRDVDPNIQTSKILIFKDFWKFLSEWFSMYEKKKTLTTTEIKTQRKAKVETYRQRQGQLQRQIWLQESNRNRKRSH